jgi:hypothetical protein
MISYFGPNPSVTEHLFRDDTPVLLVGNCSTCPKSEQDISQFPGYVVRFNGNWEPHQRVDTMVWAQDMLSQPMAREKMIEMDNSCRHILRFEFQDPTIPYSDQYSTGMMLFLWLTKWTKKPIYTTGFDFAESSSQTTLKFPGNPMLAHMWKIEREIASTNPQWMDYTQGYTAMVE